MIRVILIIILMLIRLTNKHIIIILLVIIRITNNTPNQHNHASNVTDNQMYNDNDNGDDN